jgi:hypothetical protein
VLSRRSNRYYGRLRRPPGQRSTSRREPVIGRHAPAADPQAAGPGRASPVPAATLDTFRAPYAGESFTAAIQVLHRFHGPHPEFGGSALPAPALTGGPLTTPQASRHATDRIVAPPYRALDAGLRPGPFPGQAASLLPGLLAATRTGLPPAGDDELTNTKIHHGLTSRCHLPLCWAHELTGLAVMILAHAVAELHTLLATARALRIRGTRAKAATAIPGEGEPQETHVADRSETTCRDLDELHFAVVGAYAVVPVTSQVTTTQDAVDHGQTYPDGTPF